MFKSLDALLYNLKYIIKHLPGYVYLKNSQAEYIAANDNWAHIIGLKHGEELIGLNDTQLPIFEINDKLLKFLNADLDIMTQAKEKTFESHFNINGTNLTIFVHKIPILDINSDSSIGLICICTDIANLQTQNERVWILENVIAKIPGHIWWKDKNLKFLGCNDGQAKTVGLKSRYEIISKKSIDITSKKQSVTEMEKQALEIDRRDRKIISSGIGLTVEEPLVQLDGTEAIYLSKKEPMIDHYGNIIGLIGMSFDITAQKEAEKLKIKNKKLEFERQQQQKFKNTVDQMVHDIGTPLATINMLLASCSNLPEDIRIGVREALSRINGITHDVLDQYTTAKEHNPSQQELAEGLILSSTLMQAITEKQYQYRDRTNIKFNYEFAQDSIFIFIKMQVNAFKRMISNLMNNAVDALEQGGNVTVQLSRHEDKVTINIVDTGKGMPPAIIAKIFDNIAVTSGKDNGHGIGMGQVRDTLRHNRGELTIKSELNVGTTIALTFPILRDPAWIATKIELNTDDLVLILDDDSSIHNAWQHKFKAQAPQIALKHFTTGNDLFEFIETLKKNDNILLLADYELLNQQLNGLEIIKQIKIKRAILVTSHYANTKIQKLATASKIKILPKQLASEVAIVINHTPATIANSTTSAESIATLVIVDDEENFGRFLVSVLAQSRQVDYYSDANDLLNNLSKYPLNTKFSLDNQLPFISGIELAKQLYSLGYYNLYILSGEHIPNAIMPPYLTLILKSDLDFLDKLKTL